MPIALLIAGAAFLLGMLAGACLLRMRVVKFGQRALIEIGRPFQEPEIDPTTGNEVQRRWIWAIGRGGKG